MDTMKGGRWTLIGFILLALGLVSLILSMVGLKLDFLFFLNALPPGGQLLAQVIMIFGGVILMYWSRVDEE
jgi:hypothetical protein